MEFEKFAVQVTVTFIKHSFNQSLCHFLVDITNNRIFMDYVLNLFTDIFFLHI